eukprot:TRINITY_DN80990_c0_g1_i2.p1 TRINITY_DN80990_c0_g1~~TRINITY_DN80990_c0_g1_i2.p1  ORF type:complete len:352 (+),score=68.21 TRINITY_DN80990_c0_g1_i2:70-1125(+)
MAALHEHLQWQYEEQQRLKHEAVVAIDGERRPLTKSDRAKNMAASATYYVGDKICNATARVATAAGGCTISGIKTTVVTSWAVAKPPILGVCSYIVTPGGFLTSGSTACAFVSLQLSAVSSACSAASVAVNAASAALQTSAEVVHATGDTDALRKALADPGYAQELQGIITERRQQSRRQQLKQRCTAWAALLNSSVIARVSPRVSSLVSHRVLPQKDIASALQQGGGALDDLLTSQRAALLESMKLFTAINNWLNTRATSHVEDLRGSSGKSIESLLEVVQQIAKYRALGVVTGTRAAAQDVLVAAGAVGTSAAGAMANTVVGVVSMPFSLLPSLPQGQPEECEGATILL